MIPENIIRSALPPFEHPQQPFGEYLRTRICSQDPDKIALIDPITGAKLTYSQLDKKCNELGSALVKLNISQHDVIAFFADNSFEYSVFMYTAMYLGLTFALIRPADGPFELNGQINISKAKILIYGKNKVNVIEKMIANPTYLDKINELKFIVQLNLIEPYPLVVNGKPISPKVWTSAQLFAMGEGACLPQIPFFPVEDPATTKFFVSFTSGTTGNPKGAIQSHRSFLAAVQNIRVQDKDYGLTVGISMPLGHISGTIFTARSLICGMTIVLFDGNDTEHILKSVEKFRINHLIISQVCMTDMAKKNYSLLYDLSCLKQFGFGGSKFASDLCKSLKEMYKVEMFELYGATEFMGAVNNAITCPMLLDQDFEPGNVGPVCANIEMKVIDLETSAALPSSKQGELCFRGPPCFIGYLDNLEATKDTIDSEGWYHSGDVGYYDERGHIFICDRIKEMLKFRIWSVSPIEIENFINTHPAVRLACVVGVRHATDGMYVRAYVELVDNKQTVTEQDLIKYVEDNMGFQKRLRGGVRFVEKIPLTNVGKVIRKHFKNLVKDELITEQID